MTPRRSNRDKISADEALPTYELHNLRHRGFPYQICWDFEERTHEGMEGEPERVSFDYMYVNTPDLKEQTLLTAGIPQEIINHIINN